MPNTKLETEARHFRPGEDPNTPEGKGWEVINTHKITTEGKHGPTEWIVWNFQRQVEVEDDDDSKLPKPDDFT